MITLFKVSSTAKSYICAPGVVNFSSKDNLFSQILILVSCKVEETKR